MPSFAKTALSTAAAIALVQFCPAPFLAAIPAAAAAGISAVSAAVGAAGTVAGAVVAGVKDRREVHPHRRQEQNQLAWSICRDQLTTASLTFSSPMAGNVLVEGMPPACMTLATVITGQFNVGNPIPMGSSSILFQNLSSEDMQEIQNALDAHPAKM
ncbi:hypothetical protein SAMD00023353_1101730 [Rosellinia necatrix]|uniref:Uncharacterized protein n=1 Tax=Rosellinia necatrix TaxID=77044 RepID=A0A1S7UMQ7_ROSNE|nr:hypothetical protein SAMD00023353_1101730 [Rosellinia necatrix]